MPVAVTDIGLPADAKDERARVFQRSVLTLNGETVAMDTDRNEPADRRSARRLAAAHRVEVVLPVDILVGRLKADSPPIPLKLEGVTINVSLTGMLARLNQLVPPGTTCVIRFLVSEDQVAPEILRATVRRAEPTETGCDIAVEFGTVLEVLKIADAKDDDPAAQ